MDEGSVEVVQNFYAPGVDELLECSWELRAQLFVCHNINQDECRGRFFHPNRWYIFIPLMSAQLNIPYQLVVYI